MQTTERDLGELFQQHTSKATQLARQLLSNSELRTDAMFYLGTTQMYLAAHHADQNNWLRAYWFGKEGIRYLERVVVIDSTYYDAYLGLGLYHYYADVMPKFLKTVTSLLGIKGERKRGLQELRMAAEKGTYSRAEVLFFLMIIHLEMERDYEQALNYSKRLTELHPKGFLLLHAETLQQNGYHTEAAEVLKTAIKVYDRPNLHFFQVLAHYRLGRIYFERNAFERAIPYFKQTLNLADKPSEKLRSIAARSRF